MSQAYADRTKAGRELAASLGEFAGRDGAVVPALPRGGVPVAAEVAGRLDLPLDVMVTAKMRAPGQEELALGAVGPGDVEVLNDRLGKVFRLPKKALGTLAESARREAKRREQTYRGSRSAPEVHGRTVILVDDGLATGASMRAAVAAVREGGAARVVVAVPVGAGDTCDALREEADDVRCLIVPPLFRAVGEFYEDFGAVDDDEVRRLLAAHGKPPRAADAASAAR